MSLDIWIVASTFSLNSFLLAILGIGFFCLGLVARCSERGIAIGLQCDFKWYFRSPDKCGLRKWLRVL